MVDAMTSLIATVENHDAEKLPAARAAMRIACAHAAESAARIVDMLAADLGATSIFEAYTIERCVRDVGAAIRHIAISPNNYIVAGRISLGLDPGTTRF
jgi:alkylation response protein AidB-like acyl-CoA dehydrogenase